jgi:hypothetical protein
METRCTARRRTLALLELAMDLVRRLGNEEQPPCDQDQIAPRERVIKDCDHGLRQAHQPSEAGEQHKTEYERHQQAELTSALGLCGIKPRHQQRDEDHIIDAENDLERRQGEKSRPRLRIGKQFGSFAASSLTPKKSRAQEIQSYCA